MPDTPTPTPPPSPQDVTLLLASAARSDSDAWNRLTPIVYAELKKLAESAMRAERKAHTLQPTALVHEAFVRLAGVEGSPAWDNRAHFYGAAATTMRRILIEYARRRNAAKRGGGGGGSDGPPKREPLDDLLVAFEDRSTDLVALDDALTRLAALDKQQARIVELRFFGGLTVEDTAAALAVSPSTVERSWRMARAWLLGELAGDGNPPQGRHA